MPKVKVTWYTEEEIREEERVKQLATQITLKLREMKRDMDRIKKETDSMARQPKTRKYSVREGCSIAIDGPDGRPVKKTGGDVVDLTAKMATHYTKHKKLDPFIEEEDDEEPEAEDVEREHEIDADEEAVAESG